MAITRIYLDDDALRRTMAISGVNTEQDAVNLALRFFSSHATAEDFDHPFQGRTATAS
ncbi:type II toxin-antitoxin system VapB family antitoxin [Nocardia sp. NPDC059246]|uniref:type II toxin-antitoxin system VapB family antitoxin n=1 Tax=unclassified Nocardia TaxID=2637762 RepID=UPI00339F4137